MEVEGRGVPGDPDRSEGRGAPSSPEEEHGPVGPFPSWLWMYGTVLVYGVVMIVALTLLSRLLDPGTQ